MKRLLASAAVVVALASVLVVAPPHDEAVAAPAAIFTGEPTGQVAFVDPIVSPGQPSSHLHQFFGAFPVHMTETSAELRTHATTWREPDNHSAVWTPPLYEDGQLVPFATDSPILLYYQSVSGDEQLPPENTAGVTHEVGYRCGRGGGTITNLPPATCPSGEFVISGTFRAARDFGLTEPFPNVKFFIRYDTGPTLGELTIGSPDGGLPGAATMDDIHADYFFGWEETTFEDFLERCVRPGTGCGTDPELADADGTPVPSPSPTPLPSPSPSPSPSPAPPPVVTVPDGTSRLRCPDGATPVVESESPLIVTC